jgi:hypothetical protein
MSIPLGNERVLPKKISDNAVPLESETKQDGVFDPTVC